jgi:hypothetical protein
MEGPLRKKAAVIPFHRGGHRVELIIDCKLACADVNAKKRNLKN